MLLINDKNDIHRASFLHHWRLFLHLRPHLSSAEINGRISQIAIH